FISHMRIQHLIHVRRAIKVARHGQGIQCRQQRLGAVAAQLSNLASTSWATGKHGGIMGCHRSGLQGKGARRTLGYDGAAYTTINSLTEGGHEKDLVHLRLEQRGFGEQKSSTSRSNRLHIP